MYLRKPEGATVTIFAPYDCENYCPFCVNKQEYRDNPNFNIKEVIKSIKVMDNITPSCDFVITGGEPLADLDLLEELLDTIKIINVYRKCIEVPQHKLFINTTLPTNKYTANELINFLNGYKDVISGLNISRHLLPYVEESEDKILQYIHIPIRINCVLYNMTKEEMEISLRGFFKRFNYTNVTGVQFREDYTAATLENLYDFENNETFKNLYEILNKFELYSEENIQKGLISKEKFRWNYKFTNGINYHKTLPYSSIVCGDNIEINDIIISTRGEILSDWNGFGEKLDLEQYKVANNEKIFSKNNI